MNMNKWQLVPKLGISFGEIEITFNDLWIDICHKINLEFVHDVHRYEDVGYKYLSNILGTGADIRFDFSEEYSEILFINGNLYYEDIKFIGLEIGLVIQGLLSKKIKVLYDSKEDYYICTCLGIYFTTSESVGGSGKNVIHVGICSTEWDMTPSIYEVTAPVDLPF